MKETQLFTQIANTIRGLSTDAIDAANSGHPGLPLGCADIAAVLFGSELRHNPANPDWLGRDRFVLSAGHGSMLLYSALHVSGYALPLEDLKKFRQLNSLTPGHPEYRHTAGVETTTGPLGQGFANGAGLALAQKMAAAQLKAENLLTGKIFVLCGDGCMMEGISNEAASVAGHLKLDNLVVIYDSNDICLDGGTKECFTEDVEMRFKALNWNVTTIDGHDFNAIEAALQAARTRTGQPSLIVAKTIIGKGSPSKQGTHKVHGSPLGAEESKKAKEALGLGDGHFVVPAEVTAYFEAQKAKWAAAEAEWNKAKDAWAAANPAEAAKWEAMVNKTLPADFDAQVRAIEIPANSAGRQASSVALQKLHDLLPFLVGGSADLSCSDLTFMKNGGVVQSENYAGRNIKFGVREFGMSAMCNGIALQNFFVPFCGTFLTFSDYMRNAIRVASLMKIPVFYQFTHDSIFVGEDGPTHQPVEHIPALRLIPGVTVFRPADNNEVKAAWSWAVRNAKGPVAFCLTRQNLNDIPAAAAIATDEGVGRGAYIVKQESNSAAIDYVILSTGSEVNLALEVAAKLDAQGKSVRVVSMPSMELFDAQSKEYRDSILALNTKVGQYWAIEAQREPKWYQYVGRDGHIVMMNSFGTSAPAKECAKVFGFTADQILDRMSKEA
jgi:transketolase